VIYQSEISVATRGRGTYDLGHDVEACVRESGVRTGICYLFVRHTSASLMLCENADPAVRRDLEAFMQNLVPDGDPMFTHAAEGPDDMPAHVRSVLTQSDLSIPVRDGSSRYRASRAPVPVSRACPRFLEGPQLSR
jgi:secondary thiamine-phosphate synthase enzyme